jgi:4-amino-4-deoxy-L-arabinose transferase-like glycosyltransferase
LETPENHPRFGDIGLTAYREPIYPLFLALQFKLFGDSLRTTFVIQALLGTLTIPLCFGVAAVLLSSRAALLGTLLESVNPYHIYYAAFAATETITSIILLALVFCTLRIFKSINAGKSVSRSDLMLLILSLSAGILTRAVFVPIALVTLIFIGAARYRKSAALAPAAWTVGLLALLTAVCVSSWLIRNYLVWHTFVYQTNVGHNLVMGYNGLATGGYGHSKFLESDRALALHGYNEVERDRIFKQEAFGWIRSHPARAVSLFIKKQLTFWSPVPSIVKGYEKQFGTVWGVAFLALTLIGLVHARGNPFALKYVLAVIAAYSLVHSVALAIIRYRIPLEGLLAVFAGNGLDLSLRALIPSQKASA